MKFRAAVLRKPREALTVEMVNAAPLQSTDVLVKVRAVGLCHTDLEVIEDQLKYPMPIVLGHETAGVIPVPSRFCASATFVSDHKPSSLTAHPGSVCVVHRFKQCSIWRLSQNTPSSTTLVR
jgi:S-(hydroxymethyl)glutathione dehydrogenase / alcohol dehydrogenase